MDHIGIILAIGGLFSQIEVVRLYLYEIRMCLERTFVALSLEAQIG